MKVENLLISEEGVKKWETQTQQKCTSELIANMQREAFLELHNLEDFEDSEEILNEFVDAYWGYFADDYDLGYYCAVEIGGLNIPDNIEPYFDFEKYGRDCSFDFSELNGYYFTA